MIITKVNLLLLFYLARTIYALS